MWKTEAGLQMREERHHTSFNNVSQFSENNKQRRNADFSESSMSNFSTSLASSLSITYPCSNLFFFVYQMTLEDET